MIKYEYKILKFIHNNPNCTKSTLLKKFQDFDKYHCTISYYCHIENKVDIIRSEKECALYQQAAQLGLNVSEQGNYVDKHMINFNNDNSLIFYTTNIQFQEYYEKKKHDFWAFALPYGITTVIAATSVIIQLIELYSKYK